MLKRIFSLILTIVIAFSAMTVLANDEPVVSVILNGEKLEFDVDPIIENGRTLVPMRMIFEALGARVDWDADTFTAIAKKDDITIEIAIDDNKLYKNGEAVELDVPAKLVDGRTLVPLRAVSESLGAYVCWSDALYSVGILGAPKADSDGNYSSHTLSLADLEKFLGNIDYLRYDFEQGYLPQSLFQNPQQIEDFIGESPDEFATAVKQIWDELVAQLIMYIQEESEDAYMFKLSTDEDVLDLLNAYTKITKSTFTDSESICNVTYETTPAGKEVVLLEFDSAKAGDPMVILSKYIAIYADNGTIRYFTAENSPVMAELMGHDIYMLCEITAEGRGNYGSLEDFSKDAFLQGIDTVLVK